MRRYKIPIVSALLALVMCGAGVVPAVASEDDKGSDVSYSSRGVIVDASVAENDFLPLMSDPVGAALVKENDVPDDFSYALDENSVVLGIIDFDKTYANGSQDVASTYKSDTGLDYFVSISAPKTSEGLDKNNIKIDVVDKTDKTVKCSIGITEGQSDQLLECTKAATLSGKGDIEITASYADGKFNIRYPQRFNNGNKNPYLTLAYHLVSKTSVGNYSDQIQVRFPGLYSINTYYALKGAQGQPDTILSRFENTGLEGAAYIKSGERDIAGFDLIEKPADNKVILSKRYVDGKRYLDYAPNGATSIRPYKESDKGIVTVRVMKAVGTAGDAKVQILQADYATVVKDNLVDTSDLDNDAIWSVMYESEVLKPGQWGQTGNSNFHAGHPKGGFHDGFNVHYKILNSFNPVDPEPIYYYAPQGVVRVHYINRDGEVIKDLVSASTDGTTKTTAAVNVADVNDPDVVLDRVDYRYNKAGATYDVTTPEYKPETIVTDDGAIYYYVEQKSVTGASAEETVHVSLPDGQVADRAYTTLDSPATGSVASSTLHDVTYVYEQGGNVDVQYFAIDDEGKVIKSLSGKVTDLDGRSSVNTTEHDTVWGKPGSGYDTTDLKPSTITDDDGNVWKLVPDRREGDVEQGTVEAGVTKVVKYYYQQVKTGDVIVHYINEQGETIKEDVVDTPVSPVGREYDTAVDNKPKRITAPDGKVYEFIRVDASSAAENGKVVEGTTHVTYVYRLVQTPPVDITIVPPGKVTPVPPTTVTPAPSVTDRLPETGANTWLYVVAALSLIGAGVAAIRLGKKKLA